MEISNFEGLSLSKSFEEMSLPNILDIFNKFKASAMDDDNCEILQSGPYKFNLGAGFQIDAFKMALSANQIEAEQILAQSEL